ncbi:general secretion pathway protein GspN [Photobacterium aquae]|uniref:Type II secretion system protein N n=1 Tax=Photobacterium aquae TaxID=1195763 RepID=A0A0J1H7T5_9GAMM|nr:type II secretion system protein N [Photobacterium aquae]KLV07770.1 general secretion pathway protein GspN [Photobacterium aquae]
MKYKVLLGTSFGVALLGSLAAHMPASWAWQQVPDIRGLDVTGVDGTLWRGSASQLTWQGKNFGRLQWQVKLGSLFTGKLALDVRFGQGSSMGMTGRGVVGYGFAGPFAQNLLVSAPAQEAMKFAPPGIPVKLAGNLELTLRDYRYAAPYCESLDGSLVWSGANISSPLGGLAPGPVIAGLGCENGKLNAKVTQSSDDVSSDFDLALAPDKGYTFKGWFKPQANFPPQLGKQLGWVTQSFSWVNGPDPKGQYKVAGSGRL